MRAHDSFIVKYDAKRQNSLDKHLDESAFSFTIALNDKREGGGGGTCCEAIRLKGSGDKYEPLTLNADAGGFYTGRGTEGLLSQRVFVISSHYSSIYMRMQAVIPKATSPMALSR